MNRHILLFFILLICFNFSFSQEKRHEQAVGFCYGVGSEFKNRNYSYSNDLFKFQYFYQITTSDRKVKYGLLIQPEVNLATHQLLNFYFVEPHEEKFQEKRDTYTKFKHLREFALNIGFTARVNFSKRLSGYLLGSVGPLYVETTTERCADGLAFADVIGLGLSYKTQYIMFDLRPVVRHVSNAGTQRPNSGITTKNLEFAISLPF